MAGEGRIVDWAGHDSPLAREVFRVALGACFHMDGDADLKRMAAHRGIWQSGAIAELARRARLEDEDGE